MTVSEEGIKEKPRGVVPGDRWAILEKTTPSGKTLFRCMSCGAEAISPEKICWLPNPNSGVPGFSQSQPRLECLTWMPHPLYYYRLSSDESHEGWAHIVVSSTGYFSAVSDYGNYSFFWTHHGHKDFRQFLVGAYKSWDYFASKFSYGPGHKTKEYDGTATYEEIKKHILEARRQSGGVGKWTKEKAREEWDLLHDDCEKVYGEGEWDHWMRNTCIDEAWEFRCERWPGGLEAFCKKTLKRLSDVVEKDLEREGLLADARRR